MYRPGKIEGVSVRQSKARDERPIQQKVGLAFKEEKLRVVSGGEEPVVDFLTDLAYLQIGPKRNDSETAGSLEQHGPIISCHRPRVLRISHVLSYPVRNTAHLPGRMLHIHIHRRLVPPSTTTSSL